MKNNLFLLSMFCLALLGGASLHAGKCQKFNVNGLSLFFGPGEDPTKTAVYRVLPGMYSLRKNSNCVFTIHDDHPVYFSNQLIRGIVLLESSKREDTVEFESCMYDSTRSVLASLGSDFLPKMPHSVESVVRNSGI